MSFDPPVIFRPGQPNFSANLNETVTALAAVHDLFRVSVYHNATQAIAVSGTPSTLIFNTELEDPLGMHAPGSSDLVVPVGGDGLWRVDANFDFAAPTPSAAAGIRSGTIGKNGDTPNVFRDTRAVPTANDFSCAINMTREIYLVAGDFLRVRAHHTQGASLNVTAGSADRPQFQMRRVAF